MSEPISVPFFSTQKANQGINFLEPIKKVLDSNWFILGNEVKLFEDEFAAYVGTKHCISVANGSDALEIALRSLNVKRGDKVAVVANAGFYGSTACHSIGAVPLFVDITEASLTMCPLKLKGAVAEKPAAIIVTHLYGQMADIESLIQIAKDAGIPLIEDCAQAHGAKLNGKMAGAFGDVSCFSFYPTKNLGALGDGGAVLTSNPAIAKKVQQLRQYGWSQKYCVSEAGGRNSRLDEMQAAILRVKLPQLDRWNSDRRQIAKIYNDAFSNLDVHVPKSTGSDFVAHLYVVRIADRAGFMTYLKNLHIATDIHYPIPDHQQPAYAVDKSLQLTVTENACNSVVSLPCYPGLTSDEVSRVVDGVKKYFAARAN